MTKTGLKYEKLLLYSALFLVAVCMHATAMWSF